MHTTIFFLFHDIVEICIQETAIKRSLSKKQVSQVHIRVSLDARHSNWTANTAVGRLPNNHRAAPHQNTLGNTGTPRSAHDPGVPETTRDTGPSCTFGLTDAGSCAEAH